MSHAATADRSTLNVIDLFAGVGGMTLGFHDAAHPRLAFRNRLMVDNDRDAREVFSRNMPSVRFIVADVHRLSGSDIRAAAKLDSKETVHVLVGGPPCQGFSRLGRRALDDERNGCVLDFIRLVRELRPLVAVMENVPNIMMSHSGSFLLDITTGLSNLGYGTTADILIASDYGVPQFRKRAFVVGYRSDLGIAPEFPMRTHERITFATKLMADDRTRFEPRKLPYVSVEEAIGDLPALAAGEGDEVMFYTLPPQNDYQRSCRLGSIAIFNHRSRTHSREFLKKIEVIEEGGRNLELPDDQRFSDNYYSQAYARLHRNGIAQTITTFFGNPGSGRFTHYRDLRAITVREAARLQSFPDRFVFNGPHEVQMRHVGNAVPILLSRALAEHVLRDLASAGISQESLPTARSRSCAAVSEQRSATMRAVPNTNTTLEVALRRTLWAAGIRGYRIQGTHLPGRPDIVFPRAKVAVFVDGCFWHGCPRCYREPKTNKEYWRLKVRGNRERDQRAADGCAERGWQVLRIWEHELVERPAKVVSVIQKKLGAGTKPAGKRVRKSARKGRGR